jgi:hypothetical protein
MAGTFVESRVFEVNLPVETLKGARQYETSDLFRS